MKPRSLPLLASSALALALVAASAPASAGRKISSWVTIDTTNRYAQGNAGTVRNSADATQYIGCYARWYSTSSPIIWCYATDSSGRYASCYSQSSALIPVVAAAGTDAGFQFYWDANGACTNVQVENASYTEPKAP